MNPPSVLSSQLGQSQIHCDSENQPVNLANSIVFHFHLWLNPLGLPCSQRTTAWKNPLLIETESKRAVGCVGKHKIVISHLQSDYHQHLISMQACAESTLAEIKMKLHRFTLLYSFYHIYPKNQYWKCKKVFCGLTLSQCLRIFSVFLIRQVNTGWSWSVWTEEGFKVKSRF